MFSIGPQQMALASVLVLATMGISRWLKFDLEKDLAVASIRTVLQLAFVGFALSWIFTQRQAWITLLIFVLMSLIAAHTVTTRVKSFKRQFFIFALISLAIGVWPTGLLMLHFIFKNQALTSGQLAIPFFGLLLGNALNGISLAFLGIEKLLTESLEESETLRALGATPWESAHRLYQLIIKNALTPIINAMTVVGVVSLPGMMAGQILSGTSPLLAAKMQMVVMFSITFSAFIGSLAAIGLCHLHFFNSNYWLNFRQHINRFKYLLTSSFQVIKTSGKRK